MGVRKISDGDRVRPGQGSAPTSPSTACPCWLRKGSIGTTALEREDDRFDYGEVRFVALGLIGDRLHVLVFTEGSHEDAVRAISLRPAEKHEVRFYHGQV